jgi:hypothetical protein
MCDRKKKKLTEQAGVAVTFETRMRGVIGSIPGQSAICTDGIDASDVTTRSFQIFSNSSFIRHPPIRPYTDLILTAF